MKKRSTPAGYGNLRYSFESKLKWMPKKYPNMSPSAILEHMLEAPGGKQFYTAAIRELANELYKENPPRKEKVRLKKYLISEKKLEARGFRAMPKKENSVELLVKKLKEKVKVVEFPELLMTLMLGLALLSWCVFTLIGSIWEEIPQQIINILRYTSSGCALFLALVFFLIIIIIDPEK